MSSSKEKAAALDSASSNDGIFAIFAVDHRDSMRAVIRPEAPESVSAERLTETKLDLVRHIADLSTAVLLDPEYSVLPAIDEELVPARTAFLCAIEAQGYLGDATAPRTTLLEGWGVERAKAVGASGVKLLLLYRPDAAVADEQDRLVQEVIDQCEHFDLPLFLEPINYRVDHTSMGNRAPLGNDRRQLVIESVHRLGALGPDVLKVQFPADTSQPDFDEWHEACAELDAASPVPWTLLSGGDPYPSFAQQVEVACINGASGFLVGRALWTRVATASTEDRARLIDDEMRPQFAELAAIATKHGMSWKASATSRHRRPEQR